jgi:ATP-dependent Lon protease
MPADRAPVYVGEELPILPLANSVLFPGSIIPIDAGRPSTLALLDEWSARGVIGVAAQRDPATADPALGDVFTLGCAAEIQQLERQAGRTRVIVQGVCRIGLERELKRRPYLVAMLRSTSSTASRSSRRWCRRRAASA